MGPDYGLQAFRSWVAGEINEQSVIDTRKAEALWRISVFGAVKVRISYGTKGTRSIVELLAPCVFTVPGQCEVFAKPASADHAGVTCGVTLTQATAGARSILRRFISGPAAFELDAVAFTALAASVVSVSGVGAIAVPALSTVPLVAGATLTSGSGFQEFEP